MVETSRGEPEGGQHRERSVAAKGGPRAHVDHLRNAHRAFFTTAQGLVRPSRHPLQAGVFLFMDDRGSGALYWHFGRALRNCRGRSIVYTRRIPDIDPLQDDASLVDVIRRESELSQQPNPRGCFRIGLANHAGLVYRSVAGDDLSEFVQTHDALVRMGLADRFPVGEGRLEEFDAVLQPEQHTHLNDDGRRENWPFPSGGSMLT